VYFDNDHSPVIEDRLAFDCEAARAQGLRCHAWMSTRLTAVPKLKKDARRDVEWDFRTRTFKTIDKLDPFDPKVERVLADLWRSLARAGVDGVLMQDDLMMRQLEGFSDDARKAWKARTGKDLSPESLVTVTGEGKAARVKYEEPFWDFAKLKRDRLLDLAETLQAAAREINPRFETSINLYYETATNPPMGLAWTSQDIEAAAARDFERLAMMAYHRQIEQEMGVMERFELWAGLERMAETLAKVPGADERMLVKLQAIDWKDRAVIPPTELAEAAKPFRRFSLCLAPADDPKQSPVQLRALRGVTP
jgi:biofilm PGA synthesis lipoprotein PgaB